MPPRSTPPPKGSFYPPNDATTYRDLLLFEERLKTTAASLQQRKRRYQLLLFQLFVVIAFLLAEVLLPPESSLLSVPYKMTLQWLLPDIYTPETEVILHPYLASGMLFVSVTTLLLFFASGMYSEKIAYANKYVPHANRALRSFNMYLNVRKPPLRSKFYWNPLSFFFPRPTEPNTRLGSRSPSPSPTPSTPIRNRARSSSTSRPIAPIPPAANPRGELIFSSRVDRGFRESYERYRSVFERKREEKERMERRKGWFGKLRFWDRELAGGGTQAPAMPPTPGRSVSTSSTASRGRGGGSRSGTPPSTTKCGDGIMMKTRDRSRSPPSTIKRTGSETPNRRAGGDTPPSPSRQGSVRSRRGDPGGDGDLTLRTLALERSLELQQGQLGSR